MKRIFALLFIAFLVMPSANAHTELVSATPSADTSVSNFPTDVTLTFSENLMTVGGANPNKVEVFDESGKLLSGEATVNGAVITAPVGIVGNGNYSVKYRVVAQDGHVVEGGYSFSVNSDIAVASPMPISTGAEKQETHSIVPTIVSVILGAIVLLLIWRERAGS